MDIICTASGMIDTERPRQGIINIADAGFKNILFDLSMFCSCEELKKTGEMEISGKPEPLLNQCKNHGINMPVAYAPYLARDTKYMEHNAYMKYMYTNIRRLVKESVEEAAKAGCRHIVIRPLFAGIPDGELWERNREYYLELAELASRHGMMVLLENQCRDRNGHLVRGICSDAHQASEWVDALNREAGKERFGFCMDVGACSLCSQNMYDFILVLGDRIKTVILRDCDGNSENSLLPFTSVNQGAAHTDWLNLIRGLREIEFDGALVMNFSATNAAFPLQLRSQILSLAKVSADYFEWQISMKRVLKKYGTRVMFGAGNMCRNYMKCYGEEFPPLFTCDNDKRRWGERFEGLEIKPPDALKELDGSCAIFICNVYYKEIESQLREMGLSNPVEYFNDEYMPSYYLDRLERWKGEGD